MQLLIKISIAHKHLKLQSVQHLLAYGIATISKLVFSKANLSRTEIFIHKE